MLRLRADLLARVRAFFAAREVLEVETPLLAAAPVTDPHLEALHCEVERPGGMGRTRRFLQTSPEYAMKRLLAAGSGPIFQICKAFRNGEAGRRHNPEFTMLEWYRPGFDHHALMDEVDELLAATVGREPAERLTYAEALARHAGIDPHAATLDELRRAAGRGGIRLADDAGLDRDGWLELLFSHLVEPRLGHGRPAFVFDYPASQGALALVRPGTPPLAERFEVFADGLELANGYHELTDAAEQDRRFAADLERRRRLRREEVPVDRRLLEALRAGLPSCAGVALGFDRLVMLAAGVDDLRRVLAFPVDRA